jgi:hypothetical protein
MRLIIFISIIAINPNTAETAAAASSMMIRYLRIVILSA